MAAYQGTYYALSFQLVDADGDPAYNISGWTFEADIRSSTDSTATLLNLTTANSGFAVTDAVNATFEMRITAAQTEDLPVGRLVFDVLRTDASPGPVYLFGGSFKVRQPVTR